jgi:hypothetical protein
MRCTRNSRLTHAILYKAGVFESIMWGYGFRGLGVVCLMEIRSERDIYLYIYIYIYIHSGSGTSYSRIYARPIILLGRVLYMKDLRGHGNMNCDNRRLGVGRPIGIRRFVRTTNVKSFWIVSGNMYNIRTRLGECHIHGFSKRDKTVVVRNASNQTEHYIILLAC